MKLLKIENNCGYYRDESGEHIPIDKIGKDELLQLVNWTLHEDFVEFEPYDENAVQNQAHQIIYKSIYKKLQDLRNRKQEFIDESARLFIEDYEKYREA